MASDDSSLTVAAAEYCDDIFLGLDRSIRARRDGTLDPRQVIDVQFADFMADPFAFIGSIYDQLGVPLTAEAEARMREFMATHPGDGGGAGSRYTFAGTGLDEQDLRKRASEYQEYFGVISEPVV
jgi:hypothetical protein